MKLYLGFAGSKRAEEIRAKYNCYWEFSPDNVGRREGVPYFLDNGAFSAWKNQRPFPEKKFLSLMRRYPKYDFIVVPDIVAGGVESLKFSLGWLDRIMRPRYLAVQDGMLINDIVYYLEEFDGVFVGGTLPWKMETARSWADTAHLHGLKCHVGRIGTWEGLLTMHHYGVDSIDTTSPTRNRDETHLRIYYEQLRGCEMIR